MLEDLLNFLYKIPDKTKPKGMKWSQSILSPYFWWREMWHAIGGSLIASLGWVARLLGAGIWGYWILGTLLFGTILYLEIDDIKHEQPWYKTLVDVTFWMIIGFGGVMVATM